jgi:mannose-6-phosphate isomerase
MEISYNSQGTGIIDNGEFADHPLSELADLYGWELLGTAFCPAGESATGDDGPRLSRLPLHFKFIEANDLLPVQVRAVSQSAHSGPLKEDNDIQLWCVLEAKPGARLGLGLMEDVTARELLKAISEKSILACLKYFDVTAGDVILLPPGLVYAGGKGTLLLEIRQHANRIYTFYDYNRTDNEGQKMPLALIKALNTADWTKQAQCYRGLAVAINELAQKVVLATTPSFIAELYLVEDEVEEETDGGSFHVYVFTEGETIIEYGSNYLIARQGETVLLPAALGEYRLKGKFRALKVYLPDLESEIIQPLKKAGYSGKEIRKNIGGIGGGKHN